MCKFVTIDDIVAECSPRAVGNYAQILRWIFIIRAFRGWLINIFQEIIQEQYHQNLFGVLIPTLEAPEARYVFFNGIRLDIRFLAKLSIHLTPNSTFNHPPLFTLNINNCSVHAHAAAALINFCEGVERDTLLPYLDPIVERLLKLLNPGQADMSKAPKRYVQEQVITTLAMVADASEATFAKVSKLSRGHR